MCGFHMDISLNWIGKVGFRLKEYINFHNLEYVNLDEIWDMKNESLHLAAWLSSNCATSNKRRELIHELEQAGLKVGAWLIIMGNHTQFVC